MNETGPSPAGLPPWLKWLSAGGGTAVVALAIGALEVYRRFLEIRDAAVAKTLEAGALLDAGVAKAGQAEVLQTALDSCHATELVLAAALKQCGG